jgi:uncharacterized protein YcbK (DUF882 family)
MDIETVNVLQECCDHFAKTLAVYRVVLYITSAARCFEYNRSIGSSDSSQHPRCRAIDFFIYSVSTPIIYAYLDNRYPDKYGIGLYVKNGFVHLDTRTNGPARWTA